jgi:hypothetical protein
VITGGRYFLTWPRMQPALDAFPDDSDRSHNLAGLPEYQADFTRLKAISDSPDRVWKQARWKI